MMLEVINVAPTLVFKGASDDIGKVALCRQWAARAWSSSAAAYCSERSIVIFITTILFSL
jgi:hypothetical protein